MGIEKVPKNVLNEAVQIVAELKRLRETNSALLFKPYPIQRDFLGCLKKIKVLFGANRSGKTHTTSYEESLHLTGLYPDDWNGVRYDHPVDIWCVGETTFRVRDTLQEKLFGKLGQLGTGMIPLSCLEDKKIIKKPGIPNAIDKAMVKHISGGYSSIQFFSFDMGREKFGGSSIHRAWIDEEPPEEIYNELKMRVLDTNGIITISFTPLSGVTPFYDNLQEDESVGRFWLTIDDVEHLDKEAMDRLYDGMSESEKEARKYGRATVGSGKVFQFEEHEYICEDFEIPRHWRRIGGLDVGLSHPTAAVALAIDDESGCYYLYKEYSKSGSSPREHCVNLSMWNLEFAMDPTAWNRQIGSTSSVAKMYQDEGLRVFKAFHDVDPSITKIRMLISEGRFWIFSSLTSLSKELRTYRTKEGADGKQKIIKIMDDLCDATRYAVMASAKASVSGRGQVRRDIKVVEYRPANDSYSG